MVATEPPLDPKFAETLLMLQSRKVTAKGLERYIKTLLSKVAPHLLPELMKAMLSFAQARNPEGIKMAFQAYGILSQQGGGPSVTNNMFLNQSNGSGAGGSFRNRDSMIRRIEEEEARAAEARTLSVVPQLSTDASARTDGQ